MREILFRGKKKINDEWIYGYCFQKQNVYAEDGNPIEHCISDLPPFGAKIIPETVGQYTGLTDKNGTKIFEGDIVQYNTFNDFDCQSVVKFGEYKQDGSANEYSSIECIGFYVEVDNFTCPDWCENEPECFPEYLNQQNILEVASNCEVIGNIHDNPELFKGGAE